jgi:deazaflavin-dependent oxidoreductase (nitroreductase family)
MSQKAIFRLMRALNLNDRLVRNFRRGFGPTRTVLLLTTVGRKSGLPRTTPLQYERVEDKIYVAAADGRQAQWFRNILADPRVRVEIGKCAFDALAEPCTDADLIADFIELRMSRHPLMVRMIMHIFDGLPLRYSRSELVRICKDKAMVILQLEGVNSEMVNSIPTERA